MRNQLLMLTLATLTLAPLALAQETNGTRPDDAAWVDDCPPDMMCAAGADEPHAYGPEGCIECSGPAPAGETCMDGAQGNETCDPDVYYLGGPTRGPEDGSCENCRGDAAEPVTTSAGSEAEPAKSVPAAGALLAGVAIACAVFLAAKR